MIIQYNWMPNFHINRVELPKTGGKCYELQMSAINELDFCFGRLQVGKEMDLGMDSKEEA